MENSIYSIENFNEVLARIKLEMQTAKNFKPGTMNIIELTNRNHLENQHSNVLAFLLDPNERHKHPEYGDYFIELLSQKLHENHQTEIEYDDGEILEVRHEGMTFNKHRIDILIKTKTSFIIIENKTHASDQDEQLIDYTNNINDQNRQDGERREIFCVYLTLTKEDISENTLTKNEKDEYIDGYINMTYSDDILLWIKYLKTRENEDVLRSALIQYRDVLEGLTEKGAAFVEAKFITENVMTYFFEHSEMLEVASLSNFLKAYDPPFNKKEVTNEKRIVANYSLPLVIYAQFILELKKKIFYSVYLQERYGITISPDDFKLFCGESSFTDEKDWINAVKHEQEFFGIDWQSPNQYVKRYFMFANGGGKGSAVTGYKFSKPVPHEHYVGKVQYDTPTMTYEKPLNFVNGYLLSSFEEYRASLADNIAEIAFIEVIKDMEGKW